MSSVDLSLSLIKPPPGMEWADGWGAEEKNAQVRDLSAERPCVNTEQDPVSDRFSAIPSLWVQAPPAARALAEIILKKSSDEQLSDDDIQFLLGAVTRISKDKK
ncbi:hypothetical protein ACJU26_04275 [Acidithiobacillus sp. M4-SHS-6]|uniref:hypothetical protein n=1 Tax=Acidithiobacillus sp. M4-SHS-6 TaxID=3383024 RepID=UPI0039BE4B8C